MVKCSHFNELCGCKDLSEVSWKHGCKLSRRRKRKWVHLFRRLVKPYHIFRRLVKPFDIGTRLVNHLLGDGYSVAYKPITLSCILFMFIEMKFIHCYYCVMFAMKSMSMCND